MIEIPANAEEAAEVRRIVHNSENVFGILVSLDDRAAIIRGNFIEGRLDYRRIFEEMTSGCSRPTRPGGRGRRSWRWIRTATKHSASSQAPG
jgi:hypothetical protein